MFPAVWHAGYALPYIRYPVPLAYDRAGAIHPIP